jgi:hypothetical protein
MGPLFIASRLVDMGNASPAGQIDGECCLWHSPTLLTKLASSETSETSGTRQSSNDFDKPLLSTFFFFISCSIRTVMSTRSFQGTWVGPRLGSRGHAYAPSPSGLASPSSLPHACIVGGACRQTTRSQHHRRSRDMDSAAVSLSSHLISSHVFSAEIQSECNRRSSSERSTLLWLTQRRSA